MVNREFIVKSKGVEAGEKAYNKVKSGLGCDRLHHEFLPQFFCSIDSPSIKLAWIKVIKILINICVQKWKHRRWHFFYSRSNLYFTSLLQNGLHKSCTNTYIYEHQSGIRTNVMWLKLTKYWMFKLLQYHESIKFVNIYLHATFHENRWDWRVKHWQV